MASRASRVTEINIEPAEQYEDGAPLLTAAESDAYMSSRHDPPVLEISVPALQPEDETDHDMDYDDGAPHPREMDEPTLSQEFLEEMGFGADFQGTASHDALLHIQDTEIRLLENMRACLQKRLESDRKYVTNLNAFVQCASKIEDTEYHSYCSMFKAWTTVVTGTEQLVQLIQSSVDSLGTKVSEKIASLISEKKASRKLYEDERNRMEKEFTRLKDELQKNKQDYSRCVDKVRLERAKYEDLNAKGKAVKGNKIDSARQSFVQASVKLHKAHNRYILSLCEVKSYQENYNNTTLPYFLDHLQVCQEIYVQQCKDFLTEFQSKTNLGSEQHLEVYQSIEKAVELINPEKEYTEEFTTKYKSEPFSPITFEFDVKLLEDYKGNLVPNQIAVDDFTLESLTQSQKSLTEEIEGMKKKVADMEKEKTETSTRVMELRRQLATLTGDEYAEYLEKRKKFEDLKKKIAEGESLITTKSDVLKLVEGPVETLGDASPPAAMNLDTQMDAVSTNSLGEADIGKSSSRMSKLKFKAMNPFKKGSKSSAKENGTQREESYEDQTIDGSESEHDEEDDFVPNPNSTVRRLEDEDWFHGVLPREEVQRLLAKDGDFLVRESKNKRTNETQYVLSAYWQGYRHFIIQFHEGGWRFEGHVYPTIPELVNYQYKSGIPVTNKSGTILGNPILRESWELRNDDIALETKIGNGNFGEVFRGIFKKTNEVVAVKTCRDTLSEDQRKKFLMEGRILKQYDHPNIVKFIGIAAQRQPVMIIMEYVTGGALLSYLRKEGKKQAKVKSTQMCVDAACGMEYLSDKGCIHRDLAARNCLVASNNVVKISDFGMSREEEEYTVSDGMKQIPIKWTAPEALNYGKYTTACDMWSYGILMWEIFSGGQTPYPGWTNAIAREKVEQGYRMPAPTGTPDSVHKIMLRCWDHNPQTRINFRDLRQELEALIANHPKGENWG